MVLFNITTMDKTTTEILDGMSETIMGMAAMLYDIKKAVCPRDDIRYSDEEEDFYDDDE